jgi:hypothetical protein
LSRKAKRVRHLFLTLFPSLSLAVPREERGLKELDRRTGFAGWTGRNFDRIGAEKDRLWRSVG